MDALTRAAVAGTSRETPPASGLPTDGLLGSAKGKSLERNLLLRAGMRTVYRTAGRVAESGIEAPQSAPDETIPACSAKAAELLGRLLVDQRTTILLEALERLRLARLRLPHALLPGALNVEQEELRPAVATVLGERGRWLARLNPEWAWAVGDDGDLRDVWDEGALKERTSVLRRVRERDPALGRERLSETWRETPTGTLSTAEAISVLTGGLASAAFYGDGAMIASDVAAGLTGTIVKDPVQDRVAWLEYLQTVVRERKGWKDLYRECREVV
jgi:hypothetical protein